MGPYSRTLTQTTLEPFRDNVSSEFDRDISDNRDPWSVTVSVLVYVGPSPTPLPVNMLTL